MLGIALMVLGSSCSKGPDTARADGVSDDVREVLEADADGHVPAVPIVAPGRTVAPSALANAPGYTPPDDPERDAVESGRREVPRNTNLRLEGGQPSFKALLTAVVDAAVRDDRARLQALAVDAHDFEDVLWREFPESRPVTHIEATHAWGFLHRSNLSGATRGADAIDGRQLTFSHVTYSEGITPYTNFTLHRGLVLHCVDASEQPVELTFVRTVAECNGTWKVYRYAD